MRDFVNSARGSQKNENGWAVSELFVWYEKDFTRWSQAETLCEYLADYAEEDLKDWLLNQGPECDLPTFAYDWSLNESIP